MKACFISNKNEIELVLADGTRKPQKSHKLKELLQTFTDSSHYITDGPKINVLEEYKKIAIAYIEDDGTLVVSSPELIRKAIGVDINYLSPREYGEKHGTSGGFIQRMCRENRIPGVIQKGTHWMIPEDAPYPAYSRRRKNFR